MGSEQGESREEQGHSGELGVDADEMFTSDYAPKAFPLSVNYQQ